MAKKGISSIILFLLIAAGFMSCEVGLGQAVDTQPPAVEISYPDPNSVIMDWFYLSGKCSDETGINKIEVQLLESNPNSKSPFKSDIYIADVDKESNTWRLKINKKEEDGKYPIPDGKYIVQVKAIDNGKRENSANTTITIDNTAPVLIIQTPKTTIDQDKVTVFGKTLRFAGSALDDNDISEMNLSVYDSTGTTLLGKTTSTSISKSMEVNWGTYCDDDTEKDFYNEIYLGSSSSDQMNYTYNLSICDCADCWQDENGVKTEREGSGNRTNSFYIKSDKEFNSNILSNIKKGSSIFLDENGKPASSVDAIYKYKAGKYTVNKFLGTDVDYYLSKCLVNGNENESPCGTFGLKPNNNPYFTVSGLEKLNTSGDINWNNYEKSSSDKLVVNINEGLSEEALMSESYAVWLEVVESDGVTPVMNGDEPSVIKLLEARENQNFPNAVKDSWTVEEEREREAMITSGSSSDFITIPLEGLVVPKTYYRVKVYGYDQSYLDVDNGRDSFVFRIASSAIAPTLKVITDTNMYEASSNYAGASDYIQIKGTVYSNTGDNDFTITVSNGDAETPFFTVPKEKIVLRAEGPLYNWTADIPRNLSVFDQSSSGEYTLRIKASEPSTGDSSRDVTLHYDVANPSITWTSVASIIENDSAITVKHYDSTLGKLVDKTLLAHRGYVNGNITISAQVTDDVAVLPTGNEIGTLVITDGDSEKTITLKSGTINETVNLTGFNGELKIKATVQDRAGRVCESEYLYTDKAGGTYHIIAEADTERPVITLNDVDSSIINESDINIEKNLFDSSSITGFTFVVKDDDGLGKVSVLVDGNKTDMGFSANSANSSFNYTLGNLSEGVHSLEIQAVDKVYSGSEFNLENPGCVSTGVFKIAVDKANPSIEISKPEVNGYINAGVTSFDFEGTAADTNGIAKVEYLYTKNNAGDFVNESGNTVASVAAPVVVSFENESGKWKQSVDLGEWASDYYTRVYRVTDKFGRTTEKSISFYIDKAAPDVVISNPTAGYYAKSEVKLGISGTMIDLNAVSKAYYTIVPKSKSQNVGDFIIDGAVTAGWKECSIQSAGTDSNKQKFNWNATASLDDVEGEYVLYVAAIDKAGNATIKESYASCSFFVDVEAPKLDTGISNGKICYVNASGKIISGTAKDTYFNELTWACTGTLKDSGSINVDENGKWEFEISELSPGNYSYTFTATDKSGRTTTAPSVSVVYDNDPPEIDIKSVTPNIAKIIKEDGNSDRTETCVNGLVTVQGVITETNSLSSVSYSLKQGGEEKKKDALVANPGSFNILIDTTDGITDNDNLEIEVIAKDAAGNTKTVISTVKVDQSTDIPTADLSNAVIDLTDANQISVDKNLFGMGSKTVYGTAIDDDGILKIEWNIDRDTSTSGMYGSVAGGNSTSKSFQIELPSAVLTEGVHTLNIVIYDINSVSKTKTYETKFAWDNKIPTIETDFTGTFGMSEIAITVKATDNSGISSITGICNNRVKNKNDEYVTPTLSWSALNNGVRDVKVINPKNSDGSIVDGTFTITFEAKDKFGRSNETSISYTVDGTAPVFVNDFSEGASEADKIKISAGGVTYYTDELGSNWFTSDGVQIKGKIIEDNLDSLTLIVAGEPKMMTPANSYSITETFADGSQNFSIKAVDKAGNPATVGPFTVNVDSTPPVLAEITHDAGAITNSANFTVTYKAYDATSGIKKVEIYKTATFTDENLLASDIVSIPASKSAPVTGRTITVPTEKLSQGENIPVIRITDVAGKETTETLSKFIYDDVAPEVTYISPVLGATVHKKINLVASISDANLASNKDAMNPVLKYKNSTSTEYKVVDASWYETITYNNGICTYKNLDTCKFADDTIEFLLIVKDAAGNVISESGEKAGRSHSLVINQDSDRPEISLSTINTNGNTTLSSGVISGTVSDSDGVNKLYVQVTDKTVSAPSNDNWKEVTTITGSNWTYTYSKGDGVKLDGSYKLWFKVIDKNANPGTFISGSSNSLNCPKISYSGGTAVSGGIEFSIDETPPNIDKFEYQTKTDDGASYGEWMSVGINSLLGGKKYRYVRFRALAYDTVSGQDLTVKLKVGDILEEIMTLNTSGDPIETHYFYESPEIDLGSVPSKNYSVTVSASDKADKPTTNSLTIIVDNTPPTEIDHVTPSSAQEQSDSPTLNGQMNDGNGSGVDEIYYQIPTYAQSSGEPSSLTDWEKIEDATSTTWSLLIERSKLIDIGTTVKSEYSGYGDEGIYLIPVWFKLVDKAGNIGYNKKSVLIRYNPDSDRPKVEINYPVEGGDGYIEMGGTIRIQGSAEDDEGISAIYLQFDMDGDGVFENGVGVPGGQTLTLYKVLTTAGSSSGNVGDSYLEDETVPAGAEYFTAFRAVENKKNFSISLNISNLKGVHKKDDGKTMNVRAVAVDSGESVKLISAWSKTLHISVNNSAPTFSAANLKRYEGEAEIISQSYSSGSFISGSGWYVEGEIATTATQGINQLIITNTDTGADVAYLKTDSTHSDASLIKAWFTKTGDQSYSYKIPLSDVPENFRITAKDASEDEAESYSDFVVHTDNDAPEFSDVEADYVTSEKIKVYKDNYGTKGTVISADATIQNSNSALFTFTGRVSEPTNKSGFDRMVFYFKRVGSANRIYDPMVAHNNTSANRIDLEDEKTDGKVYINSEKLPALYISSSSLTRGDTTELTADVLKENAFVRKASLVKIGGQYRLITGVNSVTGTIEFTPGCDTEKYKEAEVVYAQVIDHTGESLGDDNLVKDATDDGDKMLEGYVKNSDKYTWEASVNTQNILDGPIEVHFVVFDAAGNNRHGYFESRITNSAPRITSVKIATDLNGNGEYDLSEYEQFYAMKNQSTSNGVATWNLDTKYEMGTANRWTVKSGMSVIPEFVGGTAPFKYVFTKSVSDDSLSTPVAISDSYVATGDLTIVSTDSITNSVTTTSINFTSDEIDATKSSESGEDKDITYQFSFWDSTEETIAGEDSSWTILNAKVHQDLSDGNNPTGYIRPFFWNSKKDNSLVYEYINDKNKVAESEIAGHIELEADWVKTKSDGSYYTSYDANSSGTQLDSDPKVSGNIVLRGLIYDDVRLGSLSINFSTFGEILISEYNTESKRGDWSDYTASSKIPYAKVQDESIGQNGHIASYVIVLNTEQIENSVGIDQTVTIKVVDASGRTYISTSSEGQTKDSVSATYYATEAQVKTRKFYSTIEAASVAQDNTETVIVNPEMTLISEGETSKNSGVYKYTKHSRTGFYRMDVVPYVTGLGTTLSRIERKNASVYGRTALGKYPVYYYTKNAKEGAAEPENVTVLGYNISGATVTLAGTNATATLDSSNTFALPDTAVSGKLSLAVSGINNLNNNNYDDAIGMYDGESEDEDYAYCYNRMPNGQNNNLLTDDLEIAIWGINSRSAKTSGEAISEVSMHVNPVDGKLGFGFAFGNYASYPYGVNASGAGQTNSYYRWSMDYTPVNTVRFIYDSKGHMFGVHAGTDTNAPRNARFRLTSSLWGVNSNFSSADDWNNAYSANNALRLEYMGNYQGGKAVLNGTRFLYHPQLAASVKSSTNMTNLYLMYYDSMTNELRFRAGAIANNAGFTNQTSTSSGSDNSGMFTKSSMEFGDFQDDAYRRSNAANSQVTNYAHVSVLASSSTAANGFNPGQRYSIAVVPDVTVEGKTVDVVVAVWHDPITRTLWYSYLVDPLTNNHVNVDSTTHVNSSWQTPKPILERTYSGGYCAVAVDEEKHVHIASYSKENTGSLIYTYLDSYDSMEATGFNVKNTSAVVDSYGTTGQNLTIEFAKDDAGHTIPYIGYYLASLQYPKYAYLVDTASSGKNGATWAPKDGCDAENMYTKAWESVILPTQSDFIVDDFYIGVFRGTDGKLNVIPKINETLGNTNGSCGGNGTSNPVLGYGINYGGTGYVETAQLK